MLSEDEKKAIKLLQINPSTIGDLDEELLLKLFEFKEDCSIQTLKNWAYTIILKLVAKLQKEIKEKNKQIDSMTKKINEAYIDENSFWTWFEKNFGIKPENDYSKEIKEYFKKGESN